MLLALIDDLLDLARLERGALTLDLKLVSLSEVIQRSVETVRLMSESRGVGLILAPLPEPMPPVRADALRLQQILWNLLANAIQFTPQHGRVVVRVEREPERYLVSVEDDGIGIPEGELPHVFERFRQVGRIGDAGPRGHGHRPRAGALAGRAPRRDDLGLERRRAGEPLHVRDSDPAGGAAGAGGRCSSEEPEA